MFGLFEPQHLIIILIVGLVLFGPSRLPEMGRGLGQGIKEFKSAALALTEDSEKTDAKP